MHRIRRSILAPPLLVLALLIAGAITNAAAPLALYLPAVANGAPPPQLQTIPIILVDRDSGLAGLVIMRDTRPAAVPGALRYFVATAARPEHRLRIAEDVDGVLVDVPGAPTVQLAPTDESAPAPSWMADGPKQGAVDMEGIPGGLRIVYTGRRPDDLAGPFPLWRVEIPVAGVAPRAP